MDQILNLFYCHLKALVRISEIKYIQWKLRSNKNREQVKVSSKSRHLTVHGADWCESKNYCQGLLLLVTACYRWRVIIFEKDDSKREGQDQGWSKLRRPMDYWERYIKQNIMVSRTEDRSREVVIEIENNKFPPSPKHSLLYTPGSCLSDKHCFNTTVYYFPTALC